MNQNKPQLRENTNNPSTRRGVGLDYYASNFEEEVESWSKTVSKVHYQRQVRRLASLGMNEKSLLIFKKFLEDSRFSVEPKERTELFNLVILSKNNAEAPDWCLEQASKMEEYGVIPNSETLFNLLKSFRGSPEVTESQILEVASIAKKWDINNNDISEEILFTLIERGFSELAVSSLDQIPETSLKKIIYPLLNCATELEEIDSMILSIRKAIEIDLKIEDEGLLLQIMNVAAKKKKLELCQLAWRLVKELDIEPNVLFYNCRIYLYAELGLIEDMFTTFQEKEMKGFSHCKALNRRMIRALCKKTPENLDHAYYILEKMRDNNQPVFLSSLNIVIEGCALAKELDRAYATFETIKDEFNLKPNADSYAALILGCELVNELKSAIRLVIELTRKKEGVSEEIVLSLIRACCRTKQLKEAENIMNQLSDNVSSKHYEILARAFTREGNLDKAREVASKISQTTIRIKILEWIDQFDEKEGAVKKQHKLEVDKIRNQREKRNDDDDNEDEDEEEEDWDQNSQSQ